MVPDLDIRQRHFLNSKDKKEFINALYEQNPDKIDELKKKVNEKSKIEWIKVGDDEELYAIDDKLAFWHSDDKYIPLISFLLKDDLPYKSIVVDEGAIKYMAKGADVMRPGILKIDPSIKKGDIILIKDPNHDQVLAIGEARYSGNQMKAKKSGRVVTSIHSLADHIWDFSKNFS